MRAASKTEANSGSSPTSPMVAGRYAADFLGYVDQDPGLRTSTIDQSQDLRIGIHLDNFDKLSFAERTTDRRRLAVNFAQAHVICCGHNDVLDVCQANDPHQPSRYPHTDDLRSYVGDRRPLTVLRIRLDPGQGYAAPTELLPHDGSTLAASTPPASPSGSDTGLGAPCRA